MLRQMKRRDRSLAALLGAVLVVALGACSQDDAQAPVYIPPPPQASSPAGTGSEDAAVVVGDCTIEPDTSCPGAYLSMVTLAGQDLSGADLSGADLSKSDLRKLDLTGADLTDADITNSDLTEAIVVGADLTGVRLRHANLSRTDFTGATVTTGQLSTAYLCDTIMPNGSKNSSGCDVATQTDQPDPSESPAPTGPQVVSFVAPDGAPPCPSSPPDATVTVKIKYKTSGADSVSFSTDGGEPVVQPKTSGSVSLEFSCNESSHRYTMIAEGDGGKVKKTVTVYRT